VFLPSKSKQEAAKKAPASIAMIASKSTLTHVKLMLLTMSPNPSGEQALEHKSFNSVQTSKFKKSV